jgi:protein-S-isoprenylcysteine O-methyltransferase Ste14
MIPAVCYIILMIIRTGLEDKFLSEKLEGYSEYAKQVRYRLLPGIW